MFTISVVLRGTRIAKKGTLANREIFVGRSNKCHLVLQDETVSGVHCRLIAIEGGAIVLDEGSTNGTWLNGGLVLQPTRVTLEDELRIGPFVLMVQSLIGSGSHPRARPAEAPPPARRPQANEPPTDVQLSQANVCWRLLGFQGGGSLEEARDAYLRMKAQYHPDTLAQLAPGLRAMGEQRLREIEFAWEYLQRLFRRTREVRAA